MEENIGEYFVQEFVIGLGLLGGMGIDPQGEMLKALNQILQSLYPSMSFGWLIIIISILATIAAITGAFFVGGWAGIMAVGLAFIAGIFINTQFGAGLLIISIILGLASPKIKKSFS